MKAWPIIGIALLVSAATTIVTQKVTSNGTSIAASAKESVYQRVMRTGVIRAAYITYPPALVKDTKTGKLSGTFYETLEEVAKNLNLKLEWTEEVGWGAQIEGLKTDRYDIVGSPVWANPNRGKLTTMSIPVYYSGIGVWTRADDTRFDADFSKINAAEVRIGTIDGETADLIARNVFPSAQRISSPQLTDISEKFLQIKSNKADVIFAEPFFGFEFLKTNPNTVKNVAATKPIQLLGNCYMFKENEFQFKGMLDVAIESLKGNGFVDRVLDKYEPYPGTFYRAANPYKALPQK